MFLKNIVNSTLAATCIPVGERMADSWDSTPSTKEADRFILEI